MVGMQGHMIHVYNHYKNSRELTCKSRAPCKAAIPCNELTIAEEAALFSVLFDLSLIFVVFD